MLAPPGIPPVHARHPRPGAAAVGLVYFFDRAYHVLAASPRPPKPPQD